MFLRLRAIRPLLSRSNATLSRPEAAELEAIPHHVQGSLQPLIAVKPSTCTEANPSSKIRLARRLRQRPSFFTKGRPAISMENPRKWNRPLAVGVLPVYDEALKIINKDSAALKKQCESLRAAVLKAGQGKGKDDEASGRLKEKLKLLELQSEINLPSVRWSVANGMVDLSSPVHRHLVEQRWRKAGALSLLMERMHQMNVIPDVLPNFHPSFDLRVSFHKPPWHIQVGTKRKHQFVEPGLFLLPKQTLQPPRLYTSVFHTDTRLYTLLLVDPDVPDDLNHRYQTYLHWLVPNVSLSALASKNPITDLNRHTPYIPPHPQQGTKYHRYVLLLLPQPASSEEIVVPRLSEAERLGFDVRKFIGTYGLNGNDGGGAHMWREVWDEEVTRIYRDILRFGEPRYGREQKNDRYRFEKGSKRYIPQ